MEASNRFLIKIEHTFFELTVPASSSANPDLCVRLVEFDVDTYCIQKHIVVPNNSQNASRSADRSADSASTDAIRSFSACSSNDDDILSFV